MLYQEPPRLGSRLKFWQTTGTALELPVDAAEPRDEIEMTVTAQEWKGVLTTECSDPNIVRGNRSAGSFEFTADGGIRSSRLLVHVYDSELRKVLDEPVLVALPLARLLDTISEFAQDHDRNSDLGRLSKDRFEARVTFG